MTDSIGSSKARESWATCLQKLQEERDAVDRQATIVRTEEEFRDRFLALDQDLHERQPEANYAYFARWHDQVHGFARTLDDAIGLNNTSPPIKEIFWTAALAVPEVGRSSSYRLHADPWQVAFSHDQEFDLFSEIYEELNKDFPPFEYSDLQQFPKNLKVQQCLQHIFEAYHSCYMELIKAVQIPEEEGRLQQSSQSHLLTLLRS